MLMHPLLFSDVSLLEQDAFNYIRQQIRLM